MEVVKKASKVVKMEISVARWTINDFFDHVNKHTENLYSKDFKLDGFDAEFYLNVLLYRKGSNKLNYCLYVTMEDEKPINIEFKFWLENNKGEKCAETSAKMTTFEDDEDWDIFEEILDHDELHSKVAFFGNGPVVVCCEITRISDVPEPAKVDNALRDSLWKSYKEGLYDGITIQVEDKEFKVSKIILSANSAVFERMLLTSNCKEVKTGILKITDTKAVAMEGLIEFMHRGEVDNLDSVAIDLFKLSHKYNVHPLYALCANAVGKSVNSENLFEVLVLAYEYDCEHLKQAVSGFLLDNLGKGYLINLMTTTKWLNFMNENYELANEIMTDVYDMMGAKF